MNISPYILTFSYKLHQKNIAESPFLKFSGIQMSYFETCLII